MLATVVMLVARSRDIVSPNVALTIEAVALVGTATVLMLSLRGRHNSADESPPPQLPALFGGLGFRVTLGGADGKVPDTGNPDRVASNHNPPPPP